MIWTNDKPEVEGHYWAECVGQLSGRQYKTIVNVYASDDSDGDSDNGDIDTVFWDGENMSINNSSFLRWGSEPIAEPDGE